MHVGMAGEVGMAGNVGSVGGRDGGSVRSNWGEGAKLLNGDFGFVTGGFFWIHRIDYRSSWGVEFKCC